MTIKDDIAVKGVALFDGVVSSRVDEAAVIDIEMGWRRLRKKVRKQQAVEQTAPRAKTFCDTNNFLVVAKCSIAITSSFKEYIRIKIGFGMVSWSQA
jgi:hypothetical protein